VVKFVTNRRTVPGGEKEELRPAGTFRLKTLAIMWSVLFILVGIFYYYLFTRNKPVNIPAIFTGTENSAPEFKFAVYGGEHNKLIKPMAVFYDNKEKKIYVSNTEGHTIEVFNSEGKHLLAFGGYGKGPGKLSFPYGIGLTSAGDVVVAEAGNFRVQKFSPKGEYKGLVLGQPNDHGIQKPGPLVIDAKDNIYIGDLSGNKAVILDSAGNLVKTFSGVRYPHGIALDEDKGLLYITDAGNGAVKVFEIEGSGGEPLDTVSGYPNEVGSANFSIIRGVALDQQQRLYVVDSFSSTVNVFRTDGIFLFRFGGQGYEDNTLLYPNGIDIGEDGRIYIADWANNRVVVWDK